jgi:hypothetical protein
MLTTVAVCLLTLLSLGCPGGLYGGNTNTNGNANGNGNTGGVDHSFTANLTNAQEVPPTATGASGSGTFELNAAGTQLTFDITATGLSTPVVMAHFHRAAAGVNGPIIFNLTPLIQQSNGSVTIEGTWNLGSGDVDDLLAGNLYVNIHTQQLPDGEVRGQLIEVTN